MTDQSERTLAATRPLGELRRWPRSFADRLTDPRPGVRDLVRVVRECAVRPPAHTLKEVALLPVEQGAVPHAGPGTVSVTWAGHASWVVRIGGLTVLTDPVWSRRIPGTPARVTPVGVPWSALPPVDAVVISHNHYDHMDAPTLRRLPRHTALFVPAGLGAWFRRRRFTRVTELDWWEAAELGGVRFDFVPAHHWSRRTLADGSRSLWGGWVLSDAAGPRIYFAGDSGYGHFFREIGRAHPGIDLALLPIGAYAPGRCWARCTPTPRRRSRRSSTWAPPRWRPCTGRRSCSPVSRRSNRCAGCARPGRRPDCRPAPCGTCRWAAHGCWRRAEPRALPRLVRRPCPLPLSAALVRPPWGVLGVRLTCPLYVSAGRTGSCGASEPAASPRSRRTTVGPAAMAKVRPTARATPCQGSGKREPPTTPIT